ncbi:MAG: TrkA C-terminal domain-containing protein [Candidatus Methanomethylophilaceae archaeon]|jgi:uncharacterized protein with PhoU and TrkA domain
MNRVESMLLELKDTSEFMVDLAYSSLLYNNSEIAEEVVFLETKMDELSSKIQEFIVNIGKEQPEEIAKLFVILRLQMAVEDIANAAASIADVVLRGLGDHPVIQMSIQESEVTIEKAIIADNSILRDRTLGELRLGSHSGMYLIAIKRGSQYIYGPDKNEILRAGDVMIARGPEEGADFFMGLADGSEREI